MGEKNEMIKIKSDNLSRFNSPHPVSLFQDIFGIGNQRELHKTLYQDSKLEPGDRDIWSRLHSIKKLLTQRIFLIDGFWKLPKIY